MKKILLLIIIICLSGCATKVYFTPSMATKFDVKKIQFYIAWDSPVYIAASSDTTHETSLLYPDKGKGRYKETVNIKTHKKIIRIPKGTPGVFHKKKGNWNFIYIDFGDDIILEFEKLGKSYCLTNSDIYVNGIRYEKEKRKELWYSSHLEVDISEIEIKKERVSSEKKEAKGKKIDDNP